MHRDDFQPLDPSALPHIPGDSPAVLRPYPVVDPLADDELDAAIARFATLDTPQVPRQRRRLIDLTALGAAALILGAGLTVAAPAQEAQASTAAKGPGLELKVGKSRAFVGPYVVGGKLLYCTDEGMQIGNGRVVKGGGAAKLDAETRARVNTLINTYGQVTDNRSGARVKLAVATLVAPFDKPMARNLPGMLDQLTAADRAEITRMVSESAIHAPYRATVTLQGAIPGQQGSATVTVLGSNGKPATGRVVSYVVTGGRVVRSAPKTDSAGHATVTFTAMGLGQSVVAAVTTPSGNAVWQNTPSKGHQLMIGGGFTDTIRVSDVAELCPVSLQVVKHCDCKNTGTRKVDLAFAAEDYPGAYTVDVTINGVKAAAAPLSSGGTTTVTVNVKAGDDVEAAYAINGTSYRQTLDAWSQR